MTPGESEYIAPPHNEEAEQQVIAMLLHNKENLDSIIDSLFSFHFYNDINSKIYDSIKKIIMRDDDATPISICEEFEDKKRNQIKNYLLSIYKDVISLEGITTYANIVINNYRKRKLISIAQNIISKSRDNIDTVELITTTESDLYDLSADRDSRRLSPISEITSKTINNLMSRINKDNYIGVTTGFRDLDYALGGLAPSELIILASRPSMGKTALATNIAINAATQGFKVAFFSLEMSSEEITLRILAHATGISGERLRTGSIKAEEIPKIKKTAEYLDSIPIFIDESTNIEISSMRTRARQFKRKYGIDLLIVDYVQLLRDSTARDNRTQELSIITRTLKLIAKELNIPIIALSQLSRAVEGRSDKHPMLADLRESGSIEQDADIVLFLYREEYYLLRSEPQDPEELQKWEEKLMKCHNCAEVICAKHRHGSIGTTILQFESKTCKFSDFNAKPDFM